MKHFAGNINEVKDIAKETNVKIKEGFIKVQGRII